MIYLDNAATTNYKPQQVIDAVNECMTKYPFNPNRGSSKESVILQQKLFDVRKKVSLLVNNGSEQRVVFTSGCTEAINLAVLGTAKKGHILISTTEHNAVLRCVMQLQKKGYAEVSVINPNSDGKITPDEIEPLVRKDSYLLCVSHASNVTGTAQQLYELGLFAKQHNLLFFVDCAQSMGYFPVNMQKNNIDMVAFGAHKGLHAIQGAGALAFGDKAVPRPIRFGGTGTESHLYYQPTTIPDCLESGTLPTPAIMGMGAGMDYWVSNWKNNRERIIETQSIILDGLKTINGITVYSAQNKSGIIAFNIKNEDSSVIADTLSDKYDIAVRGGLQCAPLMHKYLGTESQGVVRASTSCVTTKQECYAFLNAVEEIAKRIK